MPFPSPQVSVPMPETVPLKVIFVPEAVRSPVTVASPSVAVAPVSVRSPSMRAPAPRPTLEPADASTEPSKVVPAASVSAPLRFSRFVETVPASTRSEPAKSSWNASPTVSVPAPVFTSVPSSTPSEKTISSEEISSEPLRATEISDSACVSSSVPTLISFPLRVLFTEIFPTASVPAPLISAARLAEAAKLSSPAESVALLPTLAEETVPCESKTNLPNSRSDAKMSVPPPSPLR